jgi:hypothetical protein
MPSINVQFLGLPSEIIDFAKECTINYKFNLVVAQLFPEFKAIFVTDIDSDNNFNKISCINQIYFLKAKPDMSINDYMEFLDKNPDKLVFSLGKYTNEKLTESALSGQTNDPELLKVWKTIAKKLKAMTLSGAWVVNPNNGSKSFYKNIRYTNAAKKVFDEGIKMLPGGGWNYYVLKSEQENI